MRTLIPAAAVLVTVSLISSCGFHLQGRTPLPAPLSVTTVQAQDEQSDFVQGLRKALIASGARLERAPEQSSAVVQILTDEVTQRALTISSQNLPTEYELTYTVRFAVRAGDKELLPAQEVAVSRDYTFDVSQLLAKEHEEAILREALAKDLVGIVMRRLSSL